MNEALPTFTQALDQVTALAFTDPAVVAVEDVHVPGSAPYVLVRVVDVAAEARVRALVPILVHGVRVEVASGVDVVLT